MSRTFKTADDDAARDLRVRLDDCLPPEHLACFVVNSVALLALAALYARYGARGGEAYAPDAAALDHGYWSPATLEACADRDVEPSIDTGREPHHQSWQERFAPEPDPPPEDATAQVRMAYTLTTAVGKAIYGARA